MSTINTLPLPLPPANISLQNIADAFYLYNNYTDINTVEIHDYYGDKIVYYYSIDPAHQYPLPVTGQQIKISDFYGRGYGIFIPLTVTGNVTDYNIFTNASTYAQTVCGVSITTPNIPFRIQLINNGTISASTYSTIALQAGTGYNKYSSIGIINNGAIIGGANNTGGPKNFNLNGNFTVPGGVNIINYTIQGGGGGGGGGTEKGNGGGGGGGGGGGSASGKFNVQAGGIVTGSAGGGGGGGLGASLGNDRPNGGDGSGGGGSSISYNGVAVAIVGGGGGGKGGTPGNGGDGGSPGGRKGDSGGNDRASGNGGGGGGNGGGGGGFSDRQSTSSGTTGGSGYVNISYEAVVNGGTAIYTRVPITINNNNNGIISGGTGSGTGHLPYGTAIDGISYVSNSNAIGGTVNGAQI